MLSCFHWWKAKGKAQQGAKGICIEDFAPWRIKGEKLCLVDSDLLKVRSSLGVLPLISSVTTKLVIKPCWITLTIDVSLCSAPYLLLPVLSWFKDCKARRSQWYHESELLHTIGCRITLTRFFLEMQRFQRVFLLYKSLVNGVIHEKPYLNCLMTLTSKKTWDLF